MKLIDKAALVAEIKRLIDCCYKICAGNLDFLQKSYPEHYYSIETYKEILSFINTLEVKEVDVSNISENLAEAYEYLDYTSTGNLAHNKPMVSARLKKAIRSLFDAGLFELTHDKQYRMEHLGLKAQKGEV